MMTYQKYLTMQVGMPFEKILPHACHSPHQPPGPKQEKRVKVTVRYSAEAGLRPFYLTVANRIKSAHPDVLLEKRILPRAGSEGGTETVFEVIIDGKTVIGKKKTKMLKVSSRAGSSSRLSAPGDDDEGDGKMMGGDKKDGGKRKGDAKSGGYYGEGRGPPDVAAGGRTIFVSMEKLDHELAKARKKRRPSTTYKTKEDALRGVAAGARMGGTPTTAMLGRDEDMDVSMRMAAEGEMAEAVIRLERLKAMSTRSKI
ncbi:hypothetical protein ACHAW5_004255 [Stephanodiscus triporus]|uniref:Uncharacterized protein n=1 Tax=Stephanodiscus triporus TaxID=2934178 RepID=A0ABD3MIA1_9STRA